MSQRVAESLKVHIERLAASSVSGQPASDETLRWVSRLDEVLYARLANAGLVPQRQTATLGQFVDDFIAARTDARPNTVRNWRDTRRKLVAFFGEGRELRSIQEGDADAWRQSLVSAGFSPATVSKSVKNAR